MEKNDRASNIGGVHAFVRSLGVHTAIDVRRDSCSGRSKEGIGMEVVVMLQDRHAGV